MTNPFLALNDWRKQAAMAVNDQDIEKAFSDQAAGFVENKVGDLMDDQYRIGFEIVKKNDDNTRMVGIFAFKVEDNLLFAPVFFLNGEIKGPMIYRCDVKTFVPANKGWTSYLIESLEVKEGKGRSKSRRGDSAPLVQMQRLSFRPPGMDKGASVAAPANEAIVVEPIKWVADASYEEVEISAAELAKLKPGHLADGTPTIKMAACNETGTIGITINDSTPHCLTTNQAEDILAASGADSVDITVPGQASFTIGAAGIDQIKKAFFDNIPHNAEAWADAMLAVADKAEGNVGLIAELLREPDYGIHAAEAIIKAASSGYEFAERLATNYADPATLFPTCYTSSIEKSASVAGELALCYNTDELTKQAGTIKKEYFRDGFYILDTRPEETLSVVRETCPGELTAITEPGEYSVLKDNGEIEEKCFVAPRYVGAFGTVASSNYNNELCIDHGLPGSNIDTRYVIIKDGEATQVKHAFGFSRATAERTNMLKDSVQAGKTYFIYINKSNNIIGPVMIKSLKTVDGVGYASILSDSEFSVYSTMGIYTGERTGGVTPEAPGKPAVFNPDIPQSDLQHLVFGSDAKFIEVKLESDKNRHGWCYDSKIQKLQGFGGTRSVDAWISGEWHMPKVRIEKSDKNYCFCDCESKKAATMSRCEALVKLARDMGVSAEATYDVLAKADAEGSTEFFLEYGEKYASQYSVIDRPSFDNEFDSDFGLPVQPTHKYALRIRGEQEMSPPSSIGDMMNPTSPTGLPGLTVATSNPEDLRALADTYHLPNVFEHGVVGTLVDTFNANTLVDKYIVKLEDGVDVLGRIKFLIYWCPTDFEKSYGTDDMVNLEAEIDANFDALGDLLLKLLKKSDKIKKQGDGPTTGASDKDK